MSTGELVSSMRDSLMAAPASSHYFSFDLYFGDSKLDLAKRIGDIEGIENSSTILLVCSTLL